jgi:hypothetical protein
MKSLCKIFLIALMAVFISNAVIGNAQAAVTITGSVGSTPYLVSGMEVTTSADAIFKISFENLTSGTNISLCAGSFSDLNAGTCPLQLSLSGGPGFQFLTIVNAKKIKGKQIYVIRNAGNVSAQFTLTIE